MSKTGKLWLKLIVSFIGLVGFVYLYITLFRGGWDEDTQPGDNFLQLTSLLTGLVSGVVATTLGVSSDGSQMRSGTLGGYLTRVGGSLGPFTATGAKQLLAVLYVIGYFAMVLWATILWTGDVNEFRPQIIDGLAAVGWGIVVAVGSSFLGAQKLTNTDVDSALT